MKPSEIARIAAEERLKYQEVWSHADYRHISPTVAVMPHIWKFFEWTCNQLEAGTFVDFGCGTGRALKCVAEMENPRLHIQPINFGAPIPGSEEIYYPKKFACLGIDTAYNCLDAEVVGSFPFLICDLAQLPWAHWTPTNQEAAACGWCVDVLEHINPAVIDDVIAGLQAWAGDLCYVRIADFPETHSAAFGTPQLHLIQADEDWWKERLQHHFGDSGVRRIWLDLDAAPPRYSFVCGAAVNEMPDDMF